MFYSILVEKATIRPYAKAIFEKAICRNSHLKLILKSVPKNFGKFPGKRPLWQSWREA